jgi:hypothetical protein
MEMIVVDQASLTCEICGSLEAVRGYAESDGAESLRCEDHAIGIDPEAESIYWRSRTSRLSLGDLLAEDFT